MLLQLVLVGQTPQRMTRSRTVPSALAVAVEGCWTVGFRSRVILRRRGQFLQAQQVEWNLRRQRELRVETFAQYDSEARVLVLPGGGLHHRGFLLLRFAEGQLGYSSWREDRFGRWSQRGWFRAERCAAGERESR